MLTALAFSALAGPASLVERDLADGTRLTYHVHVGPTHANGNHRVLFALPPGPQTNQMVQDGLARWHSDFVKAGWSILSPVAPNGKLFFRESLAKLPTILSELAAAHELRFKKVFLFGISNGGISSLEVAARHPELFHSVTVLPGILHSSDRLDALKGLPVNLIAGSEDGNWIKRSKSLTAQLKKAGGNVKLHVVEGAGHSAFKQISFEFLSEFLLRDTPVDSRTN